MRTIYTLLLFLVHAVYCSAQIIPFKNYTIKENGLPSNTVYDITQDKLGYIWIATEAGLAKFNGYSFKTFGIQDGLPSSIVSALHLDKNGILLGGTEGGAVFQVKHDSIQIIYQGEYEDDLVKNLVSDDYGNIWVSSYYGLKRINKNQIFDCRANNTEINNEMFCSFIDSKNRAWFSGIDGLFFFKDSLSEVVLDKVGKQYIWDILEDSSGYMWFATQAAGVVCERPNETLIYDESNGLSSNTTLSLEADDQGNILVGTYDGGINIIKGTKVENLFYSQTDEHATWELKKDKLGRIWGRTETAGVFLYENSKIRLLNEANGLNDNSVYTIFFDENHNTWLGTEGGGISVYGKVIFEIFKTGFYEDDVTVYALEHTSDNKVLAGTYTGLNIINRNTNTISHLNTDIGEGAIIPSILVNKDEIWLGSAGGLTLLKNDKTSYYLDSLWILSSENSMFGNDLILLGDTIIIASQKGLILFRNGDYELLNESDGLISNVIQSIAVDDFNNIWCATNTGLSIWDKKIFYNYTEVDGLSNNYCTAITFDKSGVAWIGTENGLNAVTISNDFRIATKEYNQLNGLKSNSIFFIAADKKNNLWVGHNLGVDKILANRKKVINYGAIDGFLPIETNIGAVAIDNDDNVWMGTIEGVVKYSPNHDNVNITPPRVIINSIALLNDTIDNYYTEGYDEGLPKNLVLPYNKNDIVIGFDVLHYTIIEKNQIEYRLLGDNDKWQAVTGELLVRKFQNLNYGKYTFQLKAANCDGVWTDQPVEYSFTIAPPWWITWWAITTYIILLGGIFYFILILRERKLQQDKKILTQKVKERTVEIEKQKDQIEQQKQEITSSIQYAQHIQSAILPKESTLAPLLKDYFILYKPRDIVSGDFYWAYGTEQKAYIIAADCTGHGVPGAFMSMLGVSTLNELATKSDIHTSGQLLDKLREHIITTLSHTGQDDEARDGMDLSLCIIDYTNMTLQFSGAYNPLIIIRNGEAAVHKADKMPVGKHFGEMRPFNTKHIEILKKDCLYMFSDGYADQFGGKDGKKLKTAPFRRLLLDIYSKPMNEQKAILDKNITDWMRGYEQVDDILVVGIRI